MLAPVTGKLLLVISVDDNVEAVQEVTGIVLLAIEFVVELLL